MIVEGYAPPQAETADTEVVSTEFVAQTSTQPTIEQTTPVTGAGQDASGEPSTSESTQDTNQQPAHPETQTSKPESLGKAETPLKRIRELKRLAASGEFSLHEEVPQLVTLMDTYQVVKDPDRAEELLKMNLPTLKSQTEYLKLTILQDTDSHSRLISPEALEQLAPHLEQIKSSPEFQNMNVGQVVEVMVEKEKERLRAELMEDTPPSDVENSQEDQIDQESAADREAEIAEQARERVETFFARAGLIIGEVASFADQSFQESSFATFIDNFFKASEGISSSYARHAERGGKGEYIGLGEVEHHFKSKKNFVKTLHLTYKNFTQVSQQSLAQSIPEELRDVEKFNEISKEQLYARFKEMMHILESRKDLAPQVCLEMGIAESMNKREYKTATVDDRVLILLRKMNDNSRAFDKFYEAFKDKPKSEQKDT
jgi:hypothetical protein